MLSQSSYDLHHYLTEPEGFKDASKSRFLRAGFFARSEISLCAKFGVMENSLNCLSSSGKGARPVWTIPSFATKWERPNKKLK